LKTDANVNHIKNQMRNLRFSQWWSCRLKSSGMCGHVDWELPTFRRSAVPAKCL
jgi:hypothetical protein